MEFVVDVLKGGLSIIIALSPFLIPQIREFAIKRYQHSLDKILEDRKAQNDRKNYISKVRFDKEFEMYQELSEKNLTMVYSIGETVYVIRGLLTEPEEIDRHKEKVRNAIYSAELITKRYAPFIDENIFDQYHELQNQATTIFSLFKFWCRNDNSIFKTKGVRYNREDAYKAIEEKQKAFSDLSDSIIREMRDYLNSLTIEDNR